MIDVAELRRLSDQVVEIRPAWTAGGVLNVLIGLRERPLLEVEAAAMRAAVDLKARTPAAIAFADYWAKPARVSTSAGRTTPLPECANCGQSVSRTGSSPATCPDCGLPFVAVEFYSSDRGEPCPPNEEFRAALAEMRGRRGPSAIPSEEW